MDAFYASVELRKRPELRGKPVVVCGSGPRAVVTTASYEARKLAGIHSAMPAAVARRKLPDAVYLTPDFPAYREASAQVMEVLRRNVETVEVVGLDEAYLDLTGIFSPKATMRRIAGQIRENTGLTCSVGISESRMLAKITSELGKPAGLVVLSREDALERFATESPGLIPGIGPKSVLRLEAMGIANLAELRRREASELEAAFGPRSGAWLHARGRLWDETPVVVSHETKSQSTEITFDVDVRQRGELERHLVELGEELCRRLAKRELEGRSIGIKIRLDDWTNVSRSHSIAEATNDPAVVVPIALELLRAYDPQRPVRLLGVRRAAVESAGDAAPGSRARRTPRSRRRSRSCGSACPPERLRFHGHEFRAKGTVDRVASGWPGSCRLQGNRAGCGSPRLGRSRGRRRRGRGRSPAP
jgi:DNA polymerase-4